MLDIVYKQITRTTLEYQKYGVDKFGDTSGTPHGFLGVVVADVAILLVGVQNILANHLSAPSIKMDLGNPKSIKDKSQLFSALKTIHRYFSISLLTAIESASGRLCSEKGYSGTYYGEKAFRKIVQNLDKEDRIECENFYEALKIIRNACAHWFDGNLNENEKEKLTKVGLDFLIDGDELILNSARYQVITERANTCINQLSNAK